MNKFIAAILLGLMTGGWGSSRERFADKVKINNKRSTSEKAKRRLARKNRKGNRK